MQGNAIDPLGALKPHPRPGLTTVDGLVNAAADRGGVAGIALAGADPDKVRVGLINCDGADRGVVLIVKYRFPGQAAVGGFPNPAGGRPGIDYIGVRDHGVDRRDAATGGSRTNGPRFHAVEKTGVDGGRGRSWWSKC